MTVTAYHPNKGSYIRQIKAGERVTGYFAVRHKQLEPFRDRTRGQFLTLMLADRTGSLLARVWEGAPELAETFSPGDIVKAQGDIETYMDRPQLIISKLRRANDDEYDLRDFQASTEKDTAEMMAAVRSAAERIKNPHLAALVRHFYDDEGFVRLFKAAPAARRVHHAYLGGLLEHTTEVISLAEGVARLYPEIDLDLLTAGVLLHDIGKVREFDWQIDIEYTDEGQLVGHIVIGDEMVQAAIAAIADFPPELALRVRHMIVSHHGRYEWGSPRRPQTLEAVALHQIEELDAQVNRFRGLLANRAEGEPWTPYDRLLGRSLYAGRADLTIDEESQEE